MIDFILDIVSGLYNFGRRAAGIGLIGSAISSPDLICAMPLRLVHISCVISLMIASEHDNAVPFRDWQERQSSFTLYIVMPYSLF